MGEEAVDMGCFVCIPESNYGIIQNFGEHSKIVGSGFHFLACPCEAIPVNGIMTTRVREILVDVMTKTRDNTTITVLVAVQFCVHQIHGSDINDKGLQIQGNESVGTPLYDAFYSLGNVRVQLNNYVESVIRGAIPRMDLDNVFSEKDNLNKTIKEQLNEQMKTFGYDIRDALIVNLTPDAKVAASMNDINAQARMRKAANYKADADKIVLVKAAQADAQSKFLSGAGVANQRKAIVDGLRTTVNDFATSVKGATSKDVMDVLLMTQYFDMLKVMGTQGAGGTLFLPHGPHSIHTLRTQLSNSFTGSK